LKPLFGVFPVPEAAQQDAVLEQVLLADRLGLDLVGIQDHPYQRRHLDAWTLISYLAGRTERVRFFPDVANVPLRHPGVLAKSVATLDRLSGGRVELGLGAGAFWEAIGAWGGPVRSGPESVDALVEAIGIIRRVWAAERGIDAEGEHYRMHGAHGGPEPAHDIGIWLGAYGPRSAASPTAGCPRCRGCRWTRSPLARTRSTRRRARRGATRRRSGGWPTSTA
jgi:alkanesulfonate monooxygenase SsuD/methylene tetrahydromethanopterin reductase-like flavin-dependent oxidoreductase (luciferase family)